MPRVLGESGFVAVKGWWWLSALKISLPPSLLTDLTDGPWGSQGRGGALGSPWKVLVVCMHSVRVCYTSSVFSKSAAEPSSLQGHTKGFPGTRSVVSDHLLGNRLCQGQNLLSGTLAGWGVIAEDWGQRWKVTTVEPGKIIIFLNNWWGMTKLEAWRQWWVCDTAGKA